MAETEKDRNQPQLLKLIVTLHSQLLRAAGLEPDDRFVLPPDVETELSRTDWNRNDVLVGSLGSEAQFSANIRENFYYVPARFIAPSRLPIKHIAIYKSANMTEPGISICGEVADTVVKKRGDIPFPVHRGNHSEDYYYFTIKSWRRLPQTVAIKDLGVSAPKFTNMFLLEHCSQSYELFSIHSAEQYRLLHCLKTAARCEEDNIHVFSHRRHTVTLLDGKFVIRKPGGRILSEIPTGSFLQRQHYYFSTVKRLLGMNGRTDEADEQDER